jgi:hypothetical protein
MPSTSLVIPALGAYAPGYLVRNRLWENTPDYHSVRSADLPTNPYSDERFEIDQQINEGAYYEYTSGFRDYVLLPGYPLSGSDIVNDFNATYDVTDFAGLAAQVGNDATVKLLGKIADMKTNLGLMYAEADKTSGTILGLAKRVSDAYRQFVHGDLKGVAKTLNISPKTAHKSWLEYKYGWIPLLMDVKGSAEFFAQQVLGGRPPRFSCQVRGEGSYDRSADFDYDPFGGGAQSRISRRFTASYEIRRKVWCEVVNPHFNQLQQLGLTNPALYAWERIPYSFVFDWFISVGDWLAGLTALHGVEIRRSLHSNVNTMKFYRTQPRTERPFWGGTCVNDRRIAFMWKRHYGRGPFTVDPLALSIPKQFPNSFQKLVTGLALLKGANRYR